MVTNEQVYEVLRNCYDPEIPINVVDLGLIYEVQIGDDNVNVVMTLTARGCPAHRFISEQVRQQVAKIQVFQGREGVCQRHPRHMMMPTPVTAALAVVEPEALDGLRKKLDRITQLVLN